MVDASKYKGQLADVGCSRVAHHAQVILVLKLAIALGTVNVHGVLVGSAVVFVRKGVVAARALDRPVILGVHVLLHGALAAKLSPAGATFIFAIHFREMD